MRQLVTCDNSVAINLSKNPIFHCRAKHIEITSFHTRLCSKRNNWDVVYSYIGSTPRYFYKPLVDKQFFKLKDALGMSRAEE